MQQFNQKYPFIYENNPSLSLSKFLERTLYHILPYCVCLFRFPDDAGIISISTASPYSTGMGSGKKLEAPPGLPHPMSSSLPRSVTATSSLPHTSGAGSGSLSHSVASGGTVPHSVVSSGSLPHSVGGSGSLPHSVITTSSLSHSSAPSGTLPHSVVTSGSLSHSVASSGMQEPVATSSGLSPLANMTDPTGKQAVISVVGGAL